MGRCLTFVLLSVSLAAAGTGKLTGTVVDDHGTPERHLVLEACPLDMTLQAACPQTETDEAGHFAMTVVVGRNDDGTIYGQRWALHPHYEPTGGGYYPPARVPFYKSGGGYPSFQEVDITPDAPEAAVEIKLGHRAGAVTGRITDAVTGAPIKPYATVVISWASDSKIFMGVNSELAGELDPKTGQWKYHGAIEGKYRILVPADTELTLKATTIAKGYRPYQYNGVITVGSGQDKMVDIQLQPEDK